MLVVPAHAKVNLALEVTGRRPDGWHEIATVIATLDWHDLVGIRLAARGEDEDRPAVRLRLTGPYAEGLPPGEGNLAHRAALLLLELTGGPRLSLDIWVDKQVPAAAGLGGGSADAAAVLRAGTALLTATAYGAWAAPRGDLAARAVELGSDVPAVLAGGTLMATGRGELLVPVDAPPLHLAVAVAAPSSTQAAYQALLDQERTGDGRAARLAATLAARNPIDQSLLGSALEAPATRATPGLADALARLRATTPGHPWHLTGSGGAAFALAADATQAAHLAAAACSAGFPARACRTLPTPFGLLGTPAPTR